MAPQGIENPNTLTYQQSATQLNPFGQPGASGHPGQGGSQDPSLQSLTGSEGEQGDLAVSGNLAPPGPELAPGMMPAQGLVAYKPIDQSMLPKGSAISAPAPNATHANLPTSTNLGAPAINWGPYTLGPDDVVHIAVRNQREFTGVYAIGRDGKIQFGFIGDIDANGLTKEELARKVEEALKRYVRVPSVHVTIIGFNSKAIYILGRVSRPGKYAMRGDSIKIRDAVIAAGLVVQHAKLRKVHIVKSHAAKPTYRIVDLHKVLYKGKMEQNVDLVHGDIVVVPTTIWGGVNDFLNGLLSPTGHAGSVAALSAL
jgi:polysaccharide export outer membrane protein